jgi:hypothetical protein
VALPPGRDLFIIPNYKQTWGAIRKIAGAPEGVRHMTFKSPEYWSDKRFGLLVPAPVIVPGQKGQVDRAGGVVHRHDQIKRRLPTKPRRSRTGASASRSRA